MTETTGAPVFYDKPLEEQRPVHPAAETRILHRVEQNVPTVNIAVNACHPTVVDEHQRRSLVKKRTKPMYARSVYNSLLYPMIGLTSVFRWPRDPIEIKHIK